MVYPITRGVITSARIQKLTRVNPPKKKMARLNSETAIAG
jgi:hypothetical protein